MSEPSDPKQKPREKYEKPAVEVVVLSSEEALLGVCFVVGGNCAQPFSTSGP